MEKYFGKDGILMEEAQQEQLLAIKEVLIQKGIDFSELTWPEMLELANQKESEPVNPLGIIVSLRRKFRRHLSGCSPDRSITINLQPSKKAKPFGLREFQELTKSDLPEEGIVVRSSHPNRRKLFDFYGRRKR